MSAVRITRDFYERKFELNAQSICREAIRTLTAFGSSRQRCGNSSAPTLIGHLYDEAKLRLEFAKHFHVALNKQANRQADKRRKSVASTACVSRRSAIAHRQPPTANRQRRPPTAETVSLRRCHPTASVSSTRSLQLAANSKSRCTDGQNHDCVCDFLVQWQCCDVVRGGVGVEKAVVAVMHVVEADGMQDAGSEIGQMPPTVSLRRC